MRPLQTLSASELNDELGALATRCREDLNSQGIPDRDITLSYAYYAMYSGQGQDNRLPLPAPPLDVDALERVAADFHDFYDRRFGYQAPEIPIMVTSLAVVGFGPEPDIVLPSNDDAGAGDGTGTERAVIHRGEIMLDGVRKDDAPFFDRTRLREDDEIVGPAVIDDQLGTIVINPGATARVVSHGTIRIEV
jgi:N-methylhydantoinase A